MAYGLFNRSHLKVTFADHIKNSIGLLLVLKLYLMLLITNEANGDLSVAVFKQHLNSPIFAGVKSSDLLFSLDYYTGRNRLNSSCTQTAFYALPKERAQLIAHDSIKNSSCLLSVYKVHINLSGIFDSSLYRRFRNLVESNSSRVFNRDTESVCKMPGYSFALTVRVGCKEYLVCILCVLFNALYNISLASDVDIMSLKAVFYINAQSAFGQVSHVSL